MTTSVSELLFEMPAGREAALADLTPDLYRELHHIASRHLRGERRNHTLQPTALVHEAFLKLAAGREWRFTDDIHFLAVASRVMRQVLVDYARSRSTQKRAGESNKTSFSSMSLQVNHDRGPEIVDLMALDDSLAALGAEDERLARLIEMRFFGGMTAEESAEALGVSVHIVRHDLRFAQAWLRRRLSS